MKSFSKLYLTKPGSFSTFAALVGILSIFPSVSSAQEIDQKTIMDAVGKAIQAKFDLLMSRAVKITPEIAELEAGSKTVTIELENPTNDTLTVSLVMSSAVPKPFRNVVGVSVTAADSAKAKAPAKTTSLLSDDEENQVGAEDDGTYAPMGAWLKGLPKQYVILPKAKVKVVIDVNIPSDVRVGEYATWVAAEVEPKKVPAKSAGEQQKLEAVLPGGTPLKLNVVSDNPGGGVIVISSAKIVYKHTSSK